jgi:hypothetical protein
MRFNCGLGMGGVGTLLVMECTGDAADEKYTCHDEELDC